MRLFWTAIIIGLVLGWVSIGDIPINKNSDVIDVSWPNCTLLNPPSGQQGIVGINGGLNFRPNPCLAKETSWFKRLSVYVNTGYPGMALSQKYSNYPKKCSAREENCLAYNYGFNAGRYDIEYASLQGVVADRWWVDVETENSWSDSSLVNRQSLQGTVDALSRYAGVDRVGFYSYPGQWKLITGDWHNGYPAWVATGSSEKNDALLACSSPSFNGGVVLLGQYTPSLDQSHICQ